MLLLFSLLHPTSREVQSFVFGATRLEISLDFLNSFVRKGYTLVSAVLQELNGSETALPLEALDGRPVSEAIQRLQEEWERILHTCHAINTQQEFIVIPPTNIQVHIEELKRTVARGFRLRHDPLKSYSPFFMDDAIDLIRKFRELHCP
ncbi:hypothetical protein [Larkinella harenae]